MNNKEKKLKAIIELAIVESRIDELKRGRSYSSNSTYYRNRLNVLEDKKEKLQGTVEGEESEEIKLVFHVPENLVKADRSPDKVLQYLKREYLMEV